jgi:hypothetical protein
VGQEAEAAVGGGEAYVADEAVEEKAEDEEEPEPCSICFEGFTEDEPALEIKCSHTLHLVCWEDWGRH